jgi:hypothetical protein
MVAIYATLAKVIVILHAKVLVLQDAKVIVILHAKEDALHLVKVV